MINNKGLSLPNENLNIVVDFHKQAHYSAGIQYISLRNPIRSPFQILKTWLLGYCPVICYLKKEEENKKKKKSLAEIFFSFSLTGAMV